MFLQTATASLEARSYAQALDWSLVLTSQGIENAVESPVQDGRWQVVVPTAEFERASAEIRTFEQENATPWRREVRWTGLLFDARALLWWVLVVMIAFLEWRGHVALRTAGIMSSERFWQGEWWRVFTAVMLHADIGHLALNVSTGLVLLGLVMAFYGPGWGLLLSFLTGAGANVLEVFIREESYRGLGASGMVMGCLGLLAAQSLYEWHYSPREWIGRGLVAATLLVVLIGLDTQSDVLAHLLGFGFGIVFGAMICRVLPRLKRIRFLDPAAAVTCGSLVLITWVLALTAIKR